MKDLDTLNLKLGQLLYVELDQELLEGRLKTFNKKLRHIELEHARDMKTGYIYKGLQSLSLVNVRTIRVSEDETSASEEFDEENFNGTITNNISSTKESNALPNISLSHLEWQRIETQIANIIIITQFDDKYHKAIDDIRSYTVVGLVMDPQFRVRYSPLSLICIATLHTIYLFDMLALQRLGVSLQALLESKIPRKAIHYPQQRDDHPILYGALKINGISDTSIAYRMATGNKDPLNLEETVQSILNIPPMYFQSNEISQTNTHRFCRPLSKSTHITYAKLAAFQLKLHDYLLNYHLLSDYYTSCAKTHRSNWENTVTNEILQNHTVEQNEEKTNSTDESSLLTD